MFYTQALEAVEGLKGLWNQEEPAPGCCDELEAAEVRRLRKPGEAKPLYLCHGDLDQHHVLTGNNYTAIIEYNRMHLGIQASDLYRFMRKVMEKQDWNIDLGLSMLHSPVLLNEKKIDGLHFLFVPSYSIILTR